MANPDWSTFLTAYRELTQRGVPHDAAADKALYLARRGALPDKRNWRLLARQCLINEARAACNARTVSLSTPIGHSETEQGIALAHVLQGPAYADNPLRIVIAREVLAEVPTAILELFMERRGPLTSTDYVRLHRFRKWHAGRAQQSG